MALLIPVMGLIFANFLWIRKITWWENLIPLVTVIFTIIICKILIDTSRTKDTEYWGSYVEKVCYEEPWDEYIHKTCTREVPCGTDSKGHTIYCTETYDCSYVEDHPAQYYLITNIKQTISIAPSKYCWYVQRFGNENFQDMYRNYHSYDGNMYYTNFKGEFENIDPITELHSYENRVAASNSIFKYDDVDTSITKKLFSYPEIIDYKVPSLLTKRKDILNYSDAFYTLNKHNAVLGKSKECRIWFLVFDDVPISYATEQANYWKGGNKNEFIVMLSLHKDNSLNWARVCSWTEQEELKINVRNYFEVYNNTGAVDMYKAVQYVTDQVNQKFVRKHFRDFDYLSVEPTLPSIMIVYTISLIITILSIVFIVKNDIN